MYKLHNSYFVLFVIFIYFVYFVFLYIYIHTYIYTRTRVGHSGSMVPQRGHSIRRFRPCCGCSNMPWRWETPTNSSAARWSKQLAQLSFETLLRNFSQLFRYLLSAGAQLGQVQHKGTYTCTCIYIYIYI